MAEKNELVIVREFNAPRQLVFDSFTKPEHLSQWWGPKGSSISIVTADIQPGGIFHYKLTSPDNTTMYGKFVYKEIIRPGKIVFVSSFADSMGNVIPTPFPIKFPHEILNTWTLTEQSGKTTITLRGCTDQRNRRRARRLQEFILVYGAGIWRNVRSVG